MNMKSKVMRITIPAIMAALSILLELISARSDWFKITIHGIPLMFSGIMFGPLIGLATGLVTGLVVQLQNDISILSIFFGLAYIMWGVIPGLISMFFKNKNSLLLIALSAIFASIFANLSNTLALYVMSIMFEGDNFKVILFLTRWIPRIITMIVMLVPNIFLLERLITTLYPLIIREEVKLSDFLDYSIPEVTNL